MVGAATVLSAAEDPMAVAEARGAAGTAMASHKDTGAAWQQSDKAVLES